MWASHVARTLVALAAGCGPVELEGGTTGADASGAATPATSEPASDGATDTDAPSLTTASADATTAVDTTGAAESSTGLAPEVCVEGVFAGTYFAGFESSAIELCDGPDGGVWVDGAGLYACRDVFVVIEGTLCGPGQYGHLGGSDYLLTGTVVLGPCTAGSCDTRPSGCGPSDQVCGGLQECDLFDQDCPAGEKCVPTSSQDGPPWTGTSCSPHPPAPEGPGDPCDTAGADECGPGLFCFREGSARREGACVDLCETGGAPCKTGECITCAGDVDFGMCLPAMCGAGPCGC